jgi:metal-responsive CopG/Arc/MetJ family transcriptional regulator
MIKVKRTTVKLPKHMLIKIKAIAVEKETTQNNVITELIAKGLKATENEKNEMKSRVINNELIGYDPDKKLDFKDSMGIVKIDNAENIDVQDLKDSIHFKKELY